MRLLLTILFLFSTAYGQGIKGIIGKAATRYVVPDGNFSVAVGVVDTLDVPTYDADVRTTHPSVIYVDAGWNSYKYWMAHTPYPAEARENPSIVASNDGLTWDEPTTNPIEPEPAEAPMEYNSDVDLVLKEDTLFLFWRFSDFDSTWFYYKYSVNGTTWSDKVLFLRYNDPLASPTLVYKDGLWKMWAVDALETDQDPYYLVYREAAQIAGLQSADQDTSTITNTPAGFHIWHLQIRWNEAGLRYDAIITFTDINEGGAPNNSGIIHYAVATNELIFDVSDDKIPIQNDVSMYRASFVSTPYSEENGAAYELFYTKQWVIKRSLIYISGTITTSAYDGIDSIQSVYSLKNRIGTWQNFPVARVVRISDSEERDVYEKEGTLKLSDGTLLSTFGASTLKVLYNQKGDGDYVLFPNRPTVDESIFTSASWGWTHDGTDDYGETYYLAREVHGLTVTVEFTTGKFYSNKASGEYFGLNGANLTLLAAANINTPNVSDVQCVTGFFGTSALIRRDFVEMVTGSNNKPASFTHSIGSRYTGGSHVDFTNAKFGEIVFWNGIPTAGELNIVENQQKLDYIQ